MKCYNCRKPTEDLFCKTCAKKQAKGTLNIKGPSVLKIYDKI